jgi:hypothetical protein
MAAAAQTDTPAASSQVSEESGPAATEDAHTSSGPTLDDINALALKLMDTVPDVGQKLIDVVKTATSVAHSRTKELPEKFWPAVMAGFQALEPK